MKRASGISGLLKDLSHRDASRRRRAAESLAGSDERAVYPLIKALKDENPGVQDAAMRSLTAIGGETTAYMIIPLLREDSYLRNTAIIMLREIGAATVPLLYSLLKDKDDDVRKFGLDLLIDINQGVDHEEILPLLRDRNQNVRASAVKAVGAVMGREGVSHLIEALMDDEWVVFSALEALSLIRDSSAVAPIIVLLENQSAALRFAAIEALGSIGSEAAVAPLLSFLPVADDMEKREVVKSLVKIGVVPQRAEISDIVRAMLRDGEWEERMIALKGLLILREEKAVPEIIDIGGSLDPSQPESEDRLFKIREALGQFGCSDYLVGCIENPAVKYRGKIIAVDAVAEHRCRKAVPLLLRLIGEDLGEQGNGAGHQGSQGEHPEPFLVRKAAIRAVGRIGDISASGFLLDLLSLEQNRELLGEIMQSLIMLDQQTVISRMGEFDSSLREILARSLCDENALIRLSGNTDSTVRVAAVSRLGRIGAEDAIARLRELLKDSDLSVRKAALLAMGERRCCRDEIREALGDNEMSVRLCAVKALGSSGDPAMPAILLPLLSDREIAVVLAAIDAIARIGGPEAVNALAPLEDHEDPVVREKTIRALECL